MSTPVPNHHDAGLDRGAEESDVADPHRDAEIETHEILEEHATREREGHRENHMRRLGDGVERVSPLG